MTDILTGGIVREALVAEAGQLRVGGIVREVLTAGIGLSGSISAKSSGRASASVLATGVTLAGTIVAQSKARGADQPVDGAGRADPGQELPPGSRSCRISCRWRAASARNHRRSSRTCRNGSCRAEPLR
jgi:hypothetical protein